MNLYPVNLRVTNKVCIIIGGGEVAVRKIRPLLNCGALIHVVSPEAVPRIEALAESGVIKYTKRGYRKGDLEGAFLVFAATDNRKVQEEVAKDAFEKNILFNSADDPEACSFQVPARVRRGNFLLTVSTGGSSPALSAKLRRELEGRYGLEYEHFVTLLGRIRDKIVEDGDSTESHRELFEKLLEVDIIKRIREKEWASLQEELCAVLPGELNIEELFKSIIPEDDSAAPGEERRKDFGERKR